MSKRLQVLFLEEEYAKIKRHAKLSGLSLGEWVRSALRRVTDTESSRPPEAKLKMLRHATAFDGPVDDIETIKKQIVAGYLK